MVPAVLPMLVANNGIPALKAAIADPDRYACEPKVDGVRGLVVYGPDGLETRRDGTVLDGELTTGQFRTTMAALLGSKAHRADLRLVVFDVPILAGVDLRRMPWGERRERLELLAQAFDTPLELSPIIHPTTSLALDMADGRLEGIVLKDRTSTYRDGSRAGWTKVKDPSWHQREAWRFDRR